MYIVINNKEKHLSKNPPKTRLPSKFTIHKEKTLTRHFSISSLWKVLHWRFSLCQIFRTPHDSLITNCYHQTLSTVKILPRESLAQQSLINKLHPQHQFTNTALETKGSKIHYNLPRDGEVWFVPLHFVTRMVRPIVDNLPPG